MSDTLLPSGGRGVVNIAVSSIPIIGVAISIVAITLIGVSVSLVLVPATMSLAGAAARIPTAALLPALTAAGEEDDDHADEEQNHCSKNCPHTDRIECMGATAIGIHMVLDNLHRD